MYRVVTFPKASGMRETDSCPNWKSVKAAPFDSTPEFQRFKEVMHSVLAVPKKRLDVLVRAAKKESPRHGPCARADTVISVYDSIRASYAIGQAGEPRFPSVPTLLG